MASLLKVDALTGVTTAGSISVTGEGNSTTTNLQQGLAKVWQNTDVTTLQDSNNVSSVTDMSSTFESALVFNQNIGDWSTSFVKSMKDMFTRAKKFNQVSSLSAFSSSSSTLVLNGLHNMLGRRSENGSRRL